MVSYHGALINFFIVNEIHLTGSPKLWYQLTLRTIKTGHPKYTFGHFTILIVRMAGKKAKTVRHWCAKVVSHWSSKPARTWDRLAISICNKAIRTLATLAAMQCFREVYDQQLCVDQQRSQLLLSLSFWCSSGCKNSWQVSVPHKQIGFRTLNYLWAYLWVRICVWPPRETPRRRGTAGNRLCPKGGSNRLSIIIIPTLSHGWQEKQPCHAFPHRGAYTQCCKTIGNIPFVCRCWRPHILPLIPTCSHIQHPLFADPTVLLTT